MNNKQKVLGFQSHIWFWSLLLYKICVKHIKFLYISGGSGLLCASRWKGEDWQTATWVELGHPSFQVDERVGKPWMTIVDVYIRIFRYPDTWLSNQDWMNECYWGKSRSSFQVNEGVGKPRMTSLDRVPSRSCQKTVKTQMSFHKSCDELMGF